MRLPGGAGLSAGGAAATAESVAALKDILQRRGCCSTTLLRGGRLVQEAASPAAIFCCAARLWMPSCRRTAARRRTSYMTWPACTSARALSTSTSTEAADTILWTARRRHITARARCTSATAPRPWCPLRWPPQREELLRSFSVFERCRDGFADGAKLLGLHIEGPYIAKASAAHRTRASSASRTPPSTTSCWTPARTSFAGPSRPSCPAHGDGACAAGARRTAQHRPQ